MSADGDGKPYKYLDRSSAGDPIIRVVRLKAMLARIGLGKSAAYERMNPKSDRYDPTFPVPIKLSGGSRGCGAVGWIESDINRWIDSRVAAGWGRHPEITEPEKLLKAATEGVSGSVLK